jgi:hypothetical protein
MQNSRIREIDRQVFQFKIGNVEYGDHTTWQPPSEFSGDVYTFPFFFKRLSFEYEQEFRVKLDGAHELNGIAPLPECVNVEIDVPALIEHIYVAPKAPDRFKELVIELLQQCGIDNSRSLVTRTALDATPLM